MGLIMQMKNKHPIDRLLKKLARKRLIRMFKMAEICFQIAESPPKITVF